MGHQGEDKEESNTQARIPFDPVIGGSRHYAEQKYKYKDDTVVLHDDAYTNMVVHVPGGCDDQLPEIIKLLQGPDANLKLDFLAGILYDPASASDDQPPSDSTASSDTSS